MLVNYLSNFTEWILPQVCFCCGLKANKKDVDLCDICKGNLPWAVNRCYGCGLILNFAVAIYCESCNGNTKIFNRLCCLFAYDAPINFFIAQLKFHKRLALALWLGNLLAETIIAKWYVKQPLPEVIIPVPLHLLRHRQRGYNQALEICKPLANTLGIPIDQDVCKRVRKTQSQSQLSKVQRYKNLINAFDVQKTCKYRHVAIVDDVVTTGNTINAMARALSRAGIATIDVWCVARA